MPEILIETTVDVSEYVDTDIEEILNECTESEIRDAVNWLKDHNYLGHESIIIDGDQMSHSENEFYSDVDKLSELYFRLTKEDHEVIKNILKKY